MDFALKIMNFVIEAWCLYLSAIEFGDLSDISSSDSDVEDNIECRVMTIDEIRVRYYPKLLCFPQSKPKELKTVKNNIKSGSSKLTLQYYPPTRCTMRFLFFCKE